jgi:hypothetical protein
MASMISRARKLAAIAAFAALALPNSAPAQTVDDFFLLSTSVAPNVILYLDVSSNMNQIEWHPSYDPTQTPSCTHWDNSTTYTFTSADKDLVWCAATGAHKRTIYAPNNPTYWDGRYLNWYFSLPDSSPILTQIETSTVTPAGCNGAGSSTRFVSQYRRTRADAARQVFLDTLCLAEPRNIRFGLAEFRNNATDPNGAYVSVEIANPSPAHASDTEAHVGNAAIEPWEPLAEGLFQIYTYFMSRDIANVPFGKDGLTKFPVYTYDKNGVYDTGSGQLPDIQQYACQKDFVIIVTTGLGTKDDFDVEVPTNTANGFANFNNLIGDYYAENVAPFPNPDVEVPGTADERSLYLDDVAKYMQDKDLRPDFADKQDVDTYTIGFGTTSADSAYLRRVAAVGNGLAFHAQDGTELAAALLAALNDIVEKSRSFTAATVPSARTADGGDLYNSFFLPSNKTAFWEGHLRAWHFTAAGAIVDKFGHCALVDPDGGSQCNNGPFAQVCQTGQSWPACVVPFWDSGDATSAALNPGTTNSDANARQLYVSKLNGSSPPVPVRTDFDNALTAADLKISTFAVPPDPTPNSDQYPIFGSWALNAEGLADEIVAYARGCFFGTGVQTTDSAPSPDGNKPCEERPWLIGDIFHSDPIVVRNPPARTLGTAFDAFRANYIDRDRIIYTGTNGGFLEGFLAGSWNSGTQLYDEGTGVEKFGFMPWEPRTRIKKQPIDPPTARTHYVDGAPQVADAWLYSTATVATQSATEWKTILAGGLREGGRHYYALDITNPSGDTPPGGGSPIAYPAIQWEWPNEDDFNKTTAGTGCGSTYPCDYGYMGQTWGQPVIARVKLNVSSNTNSGAGFDRWVAIVSGGYDETSDPNNTTTLDPTKAAYSAAANKGRAIYMIDLKTGKVIAQQRMGYNGDANAATTPETGLLYTIASTPSVLDLDADGYADVIYVGDLGGNMWKWVLNPIGEDRVNDGSTVRTQPSWKFMKFFSAPTATVSGETYYKNIFQPPAAAFVNGKLYLAFGTGERSAIGFLGVTDCAPLSGSCTTSSASRQENNRYYVITDPDPLASAATTPAAVTETDLTDISVVGTAVTSTRGYFFRTVDGEKFVTTSAIFAGKVISASFTPSTLKAGDPGFDPCTQRGSGKLYKFNLTTGVGDFKDASNNESRFTSIGTGLPTDPKISIGVGGDDNKIVIQKSGTEIEVLDTDSASLGQGIIYWREIR